MENFTKRRRGMGAHCCFANCPNYTNSGSTKEGSKVRLHRFPIREKELCKRWIINSQRSDLTLDNIQHKRVCSKHFNVTCYSNPSDWENSRLNCNAVPFPSEVLKRPRRHTVVRTRPNGSKPDLVEADHADELEKRFSTYSKPSIDHDTDSDNANADDQPERTTLGAGSDHLQRRELGTVQSMKDHGYHYKHLKGDGYLQELGIGDAPQSSEDNFEIDLLKSSSFSNVSMKTSPKNPNATGRSSTPIKEVISNHQSSPRKRKLLLTHKNDKQSVKYADPLSKVIRKGYKVIGSPAPQRTVGTIHKAMSMKTPFKPKKEIKKQLSELEVKHKEIVEEAEILESEYTKLVCSLGSEKSDTGCQADVSLVTPIKEMSYPSSNSNLIRSPSWSPSRSVGSPNLSPVKSPNRSAVKSTQPSIKASDNSLKKNSVVSQIKIPTFEANSTSQLLAESTDKTVVNGTNQTGPAEGSSQSASHLLAQLPSLLPAHSPTSASAQQPMPLPAGRVVNSPLSVPFPLQLNKSINNNNNNNGVVKSESIKRAEDDVKKYKTASNMQCTIANHGYVINSQQQEINKLKSLTRNLKNHLKNKEAQLRKIQASFERNPYKEMIDQLTSPAREIILSQMDSLPKSNKSWSKHVIAASLAVFIKSEDAYNVVRQIFKLPCDKFLRAYYKKIQQNEGLEIPLENGCNLMNTNSDVIAMENNAAATDEHRENAVSREVCIINETDSEVHMISETDASVHMVHTTDDGVHVVTGKDSEGNLIEVVTDADGHTRTVDAANTGMRLVNVDEQMQIVNVADSDMHMVIKTDIEENTHDSVASEGHTADSSEAIEYSVHMVQEDSNSTDDKPVGVDVNERIVDDRSAEMCANDKSSALIKTEIKEDFGSSSIEKVEDYGNGNSVDRPENVSEIKGVEFCTNEMNIACSNNGDGQEVNVNTGTIKIGSDETEVKEEKADGENALEEQGLSINETAVYEIDASSTGMYAMDMDGETVYVMGSADEVIHLVDADGTPLQAISSSDSTSFLVGSPGVEVYATVAEGSEMCEVNTDRTGHPIGEIKGIEGGSDNFVNVVYAVNADVSNEMTTEEPQTVEVVGNCSDPLAIAVQDIAN